LLGHDTERVFAALAGHAGSHQAPCREANRQPGEGHGSRGVLEGVRVLEIAEGISGPLCAMMLRRFGAEVTKIEPPHGDWLRKIPLLVDGESALFRELNPGKRSIVLDLNTVAGREKLARLAGAADVVITGYRPRQLERFGIRYADLVRHNPQLVACEISGWGARGPMADLPATELAVQAMAGLTRHLGLRSGPPVRQGFDMVSVATGIAAAQAVLAALFWRIGSGAGQRVEVSMLAAALAINQWDIVAEPETVERLRPSPGIQLESYDWPPDHGFVCADGSCLIDFLGHEEGWSLFFAEIGRADLLGDPRFNTVVLIRNNKRFLSGLLNPTLRTWTLARLEPIVRNHGGTILPALDLAQVARHPQARGLCVIAGEAGDSLPTIRIPFRCTDALQADDLRPAPRLGEDDEWAS
jgi:crotonobetainyl-CoA:carnitine CoA-transferase CaiB-like acyl-CoA transferase